MVNGEAGLGSDADAADQGRHDEGRDDQDLTEEYRSHRFSRTLITSLPERLRLLELPPLVGEVAHAALDMPLKPLAQPLGGRL
jgi:hypothetical protein